jgi:queuine tRNA-ribosyltransferase
MTQTPYFYFEIIYQSTKSQARVGRIHTPHGIIDTPNFVAVGTNGTLKALDSATVNQLGLQLMFCNTFHMMVQPGTDVVKKAGGLHRYINRPHPIITDSGGFQVFSLAYGGITNEIKSRGLKKNESLVLKINEDGVLFRAYNNGRPLLLTPETSINAQKDLGADIIIPFDELPPYHIDADSLQRSFDRTHRWELRSLDAHLQNPQQQAMYAVVHGGVDPALRRKSCEILSQHPFDGFGIGGSLGCTKEQMVETVAATVPHTPMDKPRHLLGIADLQSLDACVPLGIDTFDSAYPTRSARHGVVFSSTGPVKLTRNSLSTHFEPIDKDCQCPTCKNYTVAYLHHLFKAKEATAQMLATQHNLAYMINYMATFRSQILADCI